MAPTQDPMVQRRRLRSELRRARTRAGLTQRDVAQAMDWSLSKLIRIESGSVGISTNDLKVLLRHYRVENEATVDNLIGMARASREAPWWSAFREIASKEFLTFLGYESSASGIDQFQPAVIPGLLQHEDYAHALLSPSPESGALERETDKRLELRLKRQHEILERSDPPMMRFVLDEAVLHRWIGGRDVMRRQLTHLKNLAARDYITIEVVPYDAAEHPNLTEPFVILDVPDYDSDVLYLEGPRSSLLDRENQDEIGTHRQVFERLQTLSRTTDLDTIVNKVLAELSDRAE